MNNPDLIKDLCKKYNIKPEYRRYRMWNSVPHIHMTALVIDEYVQGGGQRLITDPKYFPPEVTEELIKDAIEHNAYSLGRAIWRGTTVRRVEFIPWHELVGNYPPGYFTNRIGMDVSGK